MRFYTVHAPPVGAAGEAPDRERFVFIKDGIAWFALIVPILWLLWHRLWLALLGYIIFALVVVLIGRFGGDGLSAAAGILGQLLLALEANNLRRWSLHSRGWTEAGESFGRNVEEAEMRYFLDPGPAGVRAEPIRKAEAIARAAYPQRSAEDDERIFGLFPEPER